MSMAMLAMINELKKRVEDLERQVKELQQSKEPKTLSLKKAG